MDLLTNRMATIFVLFWGLLFVVLMHIFLPSGMGIALEQPFNDSTWAGVSLIVAVAIYYMAQNQKIIYTPLTLQLFLCCCLLTIPLIFPQSSITRSMLTFIGLWSGFLLFLGLQQFSFTKAQLNQILYLILIGISIEVSISWYEYLFLTGPNWLGYDYTLKRPAAVLNQANVTSTLYVIGFVLSAYLLPYAQYKITKFVLLFMPIFIIPILVVLSSRMGWGATALSFFLVLPYLFQKNNQDIPVQTQTRSIFLMPYLWLIATILGLLIGLLFTYAPALFHANQFGSFGTTRELTGLNGRGFIYSQALVLWKSHFWFGVGYGNYRTAILHFIGDLYQQGKSLTAGSEFTNHPHNEILYWAIEGGILGLIGILSAMLLIMQRLLKLSWPHALMMCALLLPITIHVQLELPFYSAAILWVIFILFIYLLDHESFIVESGVKKQSRLRPLISGLLKGIALLTAIVIPYVMILILVAGFYLTSYEHAPIRKNDGVINVTYFQKIMNLSPLIDGSSLVKHRYEWDLYLSILYTGLQHNNKSQIETFVHWAEQEQNNRPDLNYYKWLHIAYTALDDKKNAQRIWDEGCKLFPNTREPYFKPQYR